VRSYDYGLQKYKKAISSLEKKGLLIDPPWYTGPAVGALLIILVGTIPLEINYKTSEGSEITEYIKMEAKFWKYEKTKSGLDESVHINIKIAKFINDVIGNLGNTFVETWKQYNPDDNRKWNDEIKLLNDG